MAIQIRAAQAEDHVAVNEMIRYGQVEHAEALPHIFANVEHVVGNWWYESFLDQEDKIVLVAEIDAIIVGAAMLEMKQSLNFAPFVPRTYVYMYELAVSPAYRRRGIATQLFEASLQWGRERGVSSLELNVWAFNEKAFAFYESLGMTTLNHTMSVPVSTK